MEVGRTVHCVRVETHITRTWMNTSTKGLVLVDIETDSFPNDEVERINAEFELEGLVVWSVLKDIHSREDNACDS